MDRHSKFVIILGTDKQWYWHLQAKNGEIVAQSEGYHTEGECKIGIEAAIRAFIDSLEINADRIEKADDIRPIKVQSRPISPEADSPAS